MQIFTSATTLHPNGGQFWYDSFGFRIMKNTWLATSWGLYLTHKLWEQFD
jgi:hypothetical protein